MSEDTKQAVKPEDIEALAKQFAGIGDQVKAANAEMRAKIESGEKITAEMREKIDKALMEQGSKVEKALSEQGGKLGEQIAELKARTLEIEQKSVRRATGGGDLPKSVGEIVVEAEEVKKMDSASRGMARVRLNRKDLMNITATVGSTHSAGNSWVPADRQPIVTPPEQEFALRNLLAPGTTDAAVIEYPQETGFTNNARVVSEGGLKPKSEIIFDMKSANVRTIATIFKASRQLMDDAKGLSSYINARASYGVRLAEDDELLNGDGTGQHIKGLIPWATAYAAAFTPESPQRIDTIRLAMLQVTIALYAPTGIVLHPTDWARIQTTKDNEGRYILGNPVNGNAQMLWNLPVVTTISLDPGDFLVGNFRAAAQIFDRMELEVLLSTENVDDFEKNMVTIRAEERLALAVYRPEAFVSGTFQTTT